MKVNVLKKNENELKIEIQGADHGLCNLLQKKILLDENVDLGGYDVPHPLASSPIIYPDERQTQARNHLDFCC